MAIIYARCYALFKLKKLSTMPTPEQMMGIGRIVLTKYREQTNGQSPKLVQAPYYVGDFKAMYYPPAFSPVIDECILKFIKENPPVARPQRKI